MAKLFCFNSEHRREDNFGEVTEMILSAAARNDLTKKDRSLELKSVFHKCEPG